LILPFNHSGKSTMHRLDWNPIPRMVVNKAEFLVPTALSNSIILILQLS
jgi:hypothetical protein